jgi:hypothetical protein
MSNLGVIVYFLSYTIFYFLRSLGYTIHFLIVHTYTATRVTVLFSFTFARFVPFVALFYTLVVIPLCSSSFTIPPHSYLLLVLQQKGIHINHRAILIVYFYLIILVFILVIHDLLFKKRFYLYILFFIFTIFTLLWPLLLVIVVGF